MRSLLSHFDNSISLNEAVYQVKDANHQYGAALRLSDGGQVELLQTTNNWALSAAVEAENPEDAAVGKNKSISHSPLRVLDGALVYWTKVGKAFVNRRGQNIVKGVIRAVKYCRYINEGLPVVCGVEGGYMIPLNKRLPKMKVEGECPSPGFYYWVRVHRWAQNDAFPIAFVLGVFGPAMSPEGQLQALLNSLGLWNRQCGCFNPLQMQLSPDYLPVKGHTVFPSLTFSIDPPNCNDRQDAISFELLPNGNYLLGVHISDILSYRHLFDRNEVANRGTSVYLPHRTLHMMPIQLVEMCQLKPRCDRLVFSVLMEIDDGANVIATSFGKYIVRSCAGLSYNEADELMGDSLDAAQKIKVAHKLNKDETNAIIDRLKTLKQLANRKRKARRSAEEIFDRRELIFELDSDQYPIRVGIKPKLASEKIIEQLMIMANYQVARKLAVDFGPNSLVMYHPKPSKCSFDYLNDLVADTGVTLTGDTVLSLESEIQRLLQSACESTKAMLVLRAIQIQECAVYTRYLNSYHGHYGLNLDLYTHFTSPMRRFADLIVHQQLQMCLLRSEYAPFQLQRLNHEINLINLARSRSKKLRSKSTECYLNLMLWRQSTSLQTRGIIKSIGLASATVYVPLYGIIYDVYWPGMADYAAQGGVQVLFYPQVHSSKLNQSQHRPKTQNTLSSVVLKQGDCVGVRLYPAPMQKIKLKIQVDCFGGKYEL